MLIVGLTGSIGMGKSTAAAHLQARGLPVFDADAEVHRLYAGGKAVELVERAFPGTTAGGAIDRAKLSAVLLAQPQRFAELEAIVHPLVRDAERAFLRDAKERGMRRSPCWRSRCYSRLGPTNWSTSASSSAPSLRCSASGC